MLIMLKVNSTEVEIRFKCTGNQPIASVSSQAAENLGTPGLRTRPVSRSI